VRLDLCEFLILLFGAVWLAGIIPLDGLRCEMTGRMNECVVVFFAL
jgi:hypothetical protein